VLQADGALVIAPAACTSLTDVNVKVEYGNDMLYEDSHFVVWETSLPNLTGTILSPPLDVKLASAEWVLIQVSATSASTKIDFLLSSSPSNLLRGVDREGDLAVPIENYPRLECQN
jgi:hypothetical protein